MNDLNAAGGTSAVWQLTGKWRCQFPSTWIMYVTNVFNASPRLLFPQTRTLTSKNDDGEHDREPATGCHPNE